MERKELTGATDGKFYRYRVESNHGLTASTELRLIEYINSGWTLEHYEENVMVFRKETTKEELEKRREKLLDSISDSYKYLG